MFIWKYMQYYFSHEEELIAQSLQLLPQQPKITNT